MGPLVAFDLVGPMAHFRKFYTNSSSLSYHVPPRTTLMGVIAAMLGWSRDSYYEQLSLERARIGAVLKTPVRTIVQTVNLLQTKTEDWHGRDSRTQIPIEWVLPRGDYPDSVLRYRVYFQHEDPAITRDVAERVTALLYAYPLFLGVAFCPAWVENGRLYDGDQVEWADDAKPVFIDSVVPTERVAESSRLLTPGVRILPDRMPLDFNVDRTLRTVTSVIWEDSAQSLRLGVRGPRFHLPDDPVDLWHVFLEETSHAAG